MSGSGGDAVPAAQRTTAERGYGRKHQLARAWYAEFVVDVGEGYCTELVCLEADDGGSRWIEPGIEWDLAHDRRNPGAYLGPAHTSCNRSEGARWRNRKVEPEEDQERERAHWVL